MCSESDDKMIFYAKNKDKKMCNAFVLFQKTSIDSNQEEEKRMRERKGEKVKIERVTFIYTSTL